MLTRQTVLKIFGLLIIWRLALFGIGAIAQQLIPYAPSFPYAELFLKPSKLPQWLFSWGNFDGVHYITIAQEGYEFAGLSQAFFPVFPFLTRLTEAILNISAVLAGLIVAHFFFICFIFTVFIYVKQRFSEELAWKTLFTVLLFPTSFYLVSLYTESLFLFLAVLSFLLARNKLWFFAGLAVAIASATRLVGVFLVPALAIDLFMQQQKITRETTFADFIFIVQRFVRKNFKALSAISIGVIGLGLYMLYLWRTFQDPLYFFSVQSEFGANRQETIILLPQVFFRYLKILLTVDPYTWKYFSYVQDFLFSGIVLLLLLLALVKRKYKIKMSELAFCFAAYLLPTVTGTLSSMPRYVLVCFPLFLLIPQLLKRKWQFYTYLALSSIVLFINVILFIQGYWVA